MFFFTLLVTFSFFSFLFFFCDWRWRYFFSQYSARKNHEISANWYLILFFSYLDYSKMMRVWTLHKLIGIQLPKGMTWLVMYCKQKLSSHRFSINDRINHIVAVQNNIKGSQPFLNRTFDIILIMRIMHLTRTDYLLI